MTKVRLDTKVQRDGLAETRSQAENYIRLGYVSVNGEVIRKAGYFVDESAAVKLALGEQLVSRAGLKLASVASQFKLHFKDAVVLDVGSSTGGFTDFALQHGARKVIAVDVGTNQMHPKLHADAKVELHEQTDIRDVHTTSEPVDIVVVDVSFISLRLVLPAIHNLVGPHALVVAMLKPQFEAGDAVKHKGVIKNDRIRRDIMKQFESWLKQYFIVLDKADSAVAGTKGNQERFYLLKPSR
jgi:23S rRNA (cytidine1920-2'-O)/16S rRNA (cytidine1409-2'-O)-methyltransferase